MAVTVVRPCAMQIKSKDRHRYGENRGRTWARPGLLNIRVTAAQLDHAIRIASAVLAAASKQASLFPLALAVIGISTCRGCYRRETSTGEKLVACFGSPDV